MTTPSEDQSINTPKEPVITIEAKIAGVLALLGRTKASFVQALTEIPGCEVLRGRNILMVDDHADTIERFSGPLLVATQGSASFLLNTKEQTLDELAQAIISNNPEIVLMDYNLAGSFSGVSAVHALHAVRPDISCIGFGSDIQNAAAFIKAGAVGVAAKTGYRPASSLKEVADIISASL